MSTCAFRQVLALARAAPAAGAPPVAAATAAVEAFLYTRLGPARALLKSLHDRHFSDAAAAAALARAPHAAPAAPAAAAPAPVETRLYQRLYVQYGTVASVVCDLAAHAAAAMGRYTPCACWCWCWCCCW